MNDITKIPAHSIEAEMALLGALLVEPEAIDDIVGIIPDGQCFYRTAHGLVFDAMLTLTRAGRVMDIVTVADELTRTGNLEDAGGIDGLRELADALPSCDGIISYAEIVRDKFIRRRMIRISSDMQEAAQNQTVPASEILEGVEADIIHLWGERFSNEVEPVASITERAFHEIEQRIEVRKGNADAIPGVTTGFNVIDRLTLGFGAGELCVLAARPGHGKTSLAIQFAYNAAIKLNERPETSGGVVLFSLEMGATEIYRRLISFVANAPLKELRDGSLDPARLREVRREAKDLEGLPLYFDDCWKLSVSEMRAKVRRLSRREPVKLVVIDYLQLMSGDRRLDRYELIGEITRGIKGFAKEMELPVLVLAQLNRNVEGRGKTARPMLSDLRESGSIEQDSDVVMFIQRDWLVKPEDRNPDAIVEPAQLIIAKNRNGPVDDVPLAFRRHTASFEIADTRDYGTPSSGRWD